MKMRKFVLGMIFFVGWSVVSLSTAYAGVNGNSMFSHLKIDSQEKYHVVHQGLDDGEKIHSDRSNVWESIPASLVGSTYIQTPEADSLNSKDEYMSLSVDREVNIYVVYDMSGDARLPGWLNAENGWDDTGLSMMSDQGDIYQLYSHRYKPGQVVLGGNQQGEGSGNFNYAVIIDDNPKAAYDQVASSLTEGHSGKIYKIHRRTHCKFGQFYSSGFTVNGQDGLMTQIQENSDSEKLTSKSGSDIE